MIKQVIYKMKKMLVDISKRNILFRKMETRRKIFTTRWINMANIYRYQSNKYSRVNA